VADHAAAVDLAPRRLVAALVVCAVAGVIGWRLLAPPPAAPEMRLPFAESAGGSPSDSAVSTTGVDDPSGGGDPGGPATTAADEVVVHVAGAVASPGVERLPLGSRVIDAVEAAGGAADGADLGRVNLAAPVVDGQQVYVPVAGEQLPAPAGPVVSGGGVAGSGGLVDLNTASATELDTLPGVGPSTAAAIIAYRDEHGPFASVDELLDVRGIGEAKLEQLRDLVTV
jgi:competence protein ComEA